jgi:hypothetical protein
MKTEPLFMNAVVAIATRAAVIKFALFEWEEIARHGAGQDKRNDDNKVRIRFYLRSIATS